jgi:hypothetical protein
MGLPLDPAVPTRSPYFKSNARAGPGSSLAAFCRVTWAARGRYGLARGRLRPSGRLRDCATRTVLPAGAPRAQSRNRLLIIRTLARRRGRRWPRSRLRVVARRGKRGRWGGLCQTPYAPDSLPPHRRRPSQRLPCDRRCPRARRFRPRSPPFPSRRRPLDLNVGRVKGGARVLGVYRVAYRRT